MLDDVAAVEQGIRKLRIRLALVSRVVGPVAEYLEGGGELLVDTAGVVFPEYFLQVCALEIVIRARVAISPGGIRKSIRRQAEELRRHGIDPRGGNDVTWDGVTSPKPVDQGGAQGVIERIRSDSVARKAVIAG